MNPLQPDWLRRLDEAALSHWCHGWTTVQGPDFLSAPTSTEHAEAVARLVSATGLRAGAWVQQVHGGEVSHAREPGFMGKADAVWTSEPGLGVVGRSADCPLILVMGTDNNDHGRWGFAHASWRSTVAGITANLVRDMVTSGMQTGQTHVAICPSAGPCCYEVGPEIQEQAIAKLGPSAATCFKPHGNRQVFDLWQANCSQLTAAGIAIDQITVTGVCTICGGEQYPSHRRQSGNAGRFAAISGGY